MPIYGLLRREKERGRPKAVAVRICTDCHFSLQTVTVASASAVTGAACGENAVDGHDNGDGDRILRRPIKHPLAAECASARGLLLDAERGIDGSGSGDIDSGSGGGGGGGVRLGVLERLEADYVVQDITDDVLLEDVLEWGRIQLRTSRCLEVVCMCVLAVVEMHHSKLLEALIQLWRGCSRALAWAAKQAAAAALYSSSSPSPSRSGSDGAVDPSASVPHGPSSPAAPATESAAAIAGSSSNGHGEDSSSWRGESPPMPAATPQGADYPAAASGGIGAAAAATATEEAYPRPCDAVEAALWTTVDKATMHPAAPVVVVLIVCVLPLIYRMW